MLKGLRVLRPWTLLRSAKHYGAMRPLHNLARRWLRPYLVTVALLAGLGYLYFAFFPALSILLLLSIPDTLIAAIGPVGWAMAGAELGVAALAGLITYQLARVRLPPPGGYLIRAGDAPALFQDIEELRASYRSPAIHRICLTSRFVIETVRTPNGGFPLKYTNTLLIGLPVMQSLSPAQFKIALAGKIAQLSLKHNRLTGRIHYLRQVWAQYRAVSTVGRILGHLALRAFFSWYAPLFSFISLPAVRMDECEADTYCLDLFNDQDVLETIFAMEIYKRFLEERFWPAIHNMLHRQGDRSSCAPYSKMEKAFRQGIRNADAQRWLSSAYAEHPYTKKTLPSLRERMEAMGHSRHWVPRANSKNAARHFLADASLNVLVAQMDREWLKKPVTPPKIQHRSDHLEQDRQRLKLLHQKARHTPLNDRETLEYAMLAAKCLDRRSASALHKMLLAKNSRDAKLNFVVGRFLLSRKDPDGLRALKTAMELDMRCAAPVNRLIMQFQAEMKRTHEAGNRNANAASNRPEKLATGL